MFAVESNECVEVRLHRRWFQPMVEEGNQNLLSATSGHLPVLPRITVIHAVMMNDAVCELTFSVFSLS